jgi:hypothetical protein
MSTAIGFASEPSPAFPTCGYGKRYWSAVMPLSFPDEPDEGAMERRDKSITPSPATPPEGGPASRFDEFGVVSERGEDLSPDRDHSEKQRK